MANYLKGIALVIESKKNKTGSIYSTTYKASFSITEKEFM